MEGLASNCKTESFTMDKFPDYLKIIDIHVLIRMFSKKDYIRSL